MTDQEKMEPKKRVMRTALPGTVEWLRAKVSPAARTGAGKKENAILANCS
jgi:hypothetical protein